MTSLSTSPIWQIMEDYYNNVGPGAWVDEVVPARVTSNPYLAKIYSQLIIANMQDYLSQNNCNVQQEPFYILEIGTGHGKFSFYLLQHLTAALESYNFSLDKICYVMTDISTKNIDAWQKHPAFTKYIKAGILEFACFNAVKDKKIHLNRGTIETGQLTKPLFVICNYLLDTLPSDAFKIIDGQLYETELVVKNCKNTIPTGTNKYFDNIYFTFRQNVITSSYYADYNINNILKFYQESFKNTSFLIPVGGINFIENICKFTTSRLMFLLTDKGVAELNMFDSVEKDPEIEQHGSVSMMVNFDAIARYVGNKQGISMLMENKTSDFQTACFILNCLEPILNTTYTFNNVLSSYTIGDLFNLCYKNDKINDNLASVEDLLVILNLSEWDPGLFFDFHQTLLNSIKKEKLTTAQRIALLSGIKRVWNNYFKLEKNQDIPFIIGNILLILGELTEAINFYNFSLALFGEKEKTLYNIAMAYTHLEEHNNVIDIKDKLVKLNPNYQHLQRLPAFVNKNVMV